MTTSPDGDSAGCRLTRSLLADPVHCLALGFGAGLSSRAPGTAGSVVGLGIAASMSGQSLVVKCFLAFALSVAGVWICGASARKLGLHDHPGIVWDEICGMTITMLAAPGNWGVGWALGGFVAFRVLDITKPWPIREIDHGIPGGAGIMLDDVLAGILAALVLLLVRYIT